MPLHDSCSYFCVLSKVCLGIPSSSDHAIAQTAKLLLLFEVVTMAWWPAAVCSCVGFCWQKTPADTSLGAGACCALRCWAAPLAGCVTGCARQAGCPACLQQDSRHVCRHLSASLEYAETNTSFPSAIRRLFKEAEEKPKPKGSKRRHAGKCWMVCKGGEQTLLRGWSGWSVIHIPSLLSTCCLGWEGIRDEGRCDGSKLLPDHILLQCSSATCSTKYIVQGGSHRIEGIFLK